MNLTFKNGSIDVAPDGRITLIAGKLHFPGLYWRFYARPNCELEHLTPERVEQSGDFIRITYLWRELEVVSVIGTDADAVSFRLEVANWRDRDVEIALIELVCAGCDLQGEFLSYAAGSLPVGRDLPGQLFLPVLNPQCAVFQQNETPLMIAADVEGSENFLIASDVPHRGNVVFSFPIEDEFSCSWRRILPQTRYVSDTVRLEFPDPAAPMTELFAALRKKYGTVYPPRRSRVSQEVRTFWNSWYACKGTVNAEAVRKAVDFAVEHHLDAVEIDDGYFPAIQDLPPECESLHYGVDKTKFPEGFRPLIDYAHSRNVKIFLWCRPYMMKPGDPAGVNHPEALLKRPDGTACYWIMGNILDPVHEYTQGFIRRFFAYTNSLGFDGYKVDFMGPLAETRNAHLARGIIRPGEWAELTWKVIAEAVGDEKLIHAATPMTVAPRFRTMIDVARCWGDNDPYLLRGALGYGAFPFLRAFEYRGAWRSDPDMVYPSKKWDFLDTSTFSMELFCDAFGSSFVSRSFNWTEHMEEFSPVLRDAVKKLLAVRPEAEFIPDRLTGHAVYTAEDATTYSVFARRKETVSLPFPASGLCFGPDGLREVAVTQTLDCQPGELYLLRRR